MPSDRPSPLPRWVKVSFWTGVALFLGWLGWVQLIRDETVRAPEGFLARPETVVVSPQENGLMLLLEGLAAMRRPRGDWTHQKQQKEILGLRAPWDQEIMQPLVDAAPAVERLVQQALQKPSWSEPPDTDEFPWDLDSEFQRITHVFLAKSMDLANRGRGSEARRWITEARNFTLRYWPAADTRDCSTFAMRFFAHTDFHVFQQLDVSSDSAEELAEAQAMFTGPGLPQKEVLRFVARDYWQQMDSRSRPEYHSGRQADPMLYFLACCDDPMPPAWWIRTRYKQGAEQNRFTEIYSQLGEVAFLEGRMGRQKVADLYAVLKLESKLSFLSAEPNRTGRVLASTAALRLLEDESWFFAFEAVRRCCLTAVAAKRWSLAHQGRRPGSLQELVPDYLPGVPLDPYDAKPVRWDGASGTVYVIGEDGVEDVPVMPVLPAGRFVSPLKASPGARLP